MSMSLCRNERIRRSSPAQRPIRHTNIKGELKEKYRVENMVIDGTAYRVVAEESHSAAQTPYDVIRRLIENNRERICCLEPDGGKKIC